MDPDALYDEFGNYIGPELESDEDSDDSQDANDFEDHGMENGDRDGMEEDADEMALAEVDEDGGQSTAIVLHEDKDLEEDFKDYRMKGMPDSNTDRFDSIGLRSIPGVP